MLGNITNIFCDSKELKKKLEEVANGDIKPEEISLNFEYFNVFEDPELFDKSFKYKDRAKVFKDYPDVKTVSYGRITHPLFNEPLYEKKFSNSISHNEVMNHLRKNAAKAFNVIDKSDQDYSNKKDRKKNLRSQKKAGRIITKK